MPIQFSLFEVSPPELSVLYGTSPFFSRNLSWAKKFVDQEKLLGGNGYDSTRFQSLGPAKGGMGRESPLITSIDSF